MTPKNHAQVIGHVGSDPKIITSPNGTKIANLSIATTEKYKNANGDRVESTEWHSIIAFGVRAELIEKYVNKGSQILVSGKLQTRDYLDKDGKKTYRTEIICNELMFLDKTKNG